MSRFWLHVAQHAFLNQKKHSGLPLALKIIGVSANQTASHVVGEGCGQAGRILLGTVLLCGCARIAWLLELGTKGGTERGCYILRSFRELFE